MNTHDFRPIFGRHNAFLFTFFFLLAGVVLCGFAASTTQSSANGGAAGNNIQLPNAMPGPTGEDIQREFNDDDLKVKGEKPRGKWTFATLLDMSQFEDPLIPVAIGGIQSLSGGGKHLGVTKIKRVTIKNRASKIVNSVQLRWEVISVEDPTKVLSEGTTQVVNTWVEANDTRTIEIPTIYPALLLKPLAKDNELYGRFQITIGVQEARFADGSFWRREPPVAYLHLLYTDQFQAYGFPTLASFTNDIPPPAITSNNRSKTPPCAAEPRGLTSAFSFAPVQVTTVSCFDNSGPSEDQDGRKNCGYLAPNLTCIATCTDGYCNTDTIPGRCENPATATPTPPPGPARPSPPHVA
ncbi:MAG: hypothetical protein JOZ96_05315 [Acidobacteria bacterium]|nr:hypothetical protein [Acidobacteriota bacterium]